MIPSNTFSRLALFLLALGLLGADTCGPGDIIDNPSFDLWCGDSLCSWDVEMGSIKKVPTWHERDYGVEMVGDAVTISQVSTYHTTCIEFSLIADVEDSVSLFFEMDFIDDGRFDYQEMLPRASWRSTSYFVTMPSWYDKVRFSLRKRGPGRVVVAQIRATTSSKCGDEPLQLLDRPLGASCEVAADCANDFCATTKKDPSSWLVCSDCAEDGDCSPGQACSYAPDARDFRPWYDAHRTCEPAGGTSLGERCASDLACNTGLCCGWACSTCCDDEDCPAGEACEMAEGGHRAAYQCATGAGLSETGSACLKNEDCQSGACVGSGELSVCQHFGGRCQTDEECGTSFDPCTTIGVAFGMCE